MLFDKNIDVSIIIPVRNEDQYIDKCIFSILNSDFDLNKLEIIIIDGQSDDCTFEIAKSYSDKYPFIRVFENQFKTVPYAMNLGITMALGHTVIRMDAHAEYQPDYISKLLYWMDKLDADNVGGLCLTLPANDSLEAYVVARVLSSPFGVGNSYFRLGNLTVPREVDTVPFGCYRKSIFSLIGNYDVMMTRNQDDELNSRLRNYGGRIFLIPDIEVQYYARESLLKMSIMLYQYGYFKPLVSIKSQKITTLRQLAPPLFVMYIFSVPFIFLFFPSILPFYLIILIIYLILNFYYSLIESRKSKYKNLIYFMYGYFVGHISYGFGYLKGLLDFGVLRKNLNCGVSRIHLSR